MVKAFQSYPLYLLVYPVHRGSIGGSLMVLWQVTMFLVKVWGRPALSRPAGLCQAARPDRVASVIFLEA